MFQSDRRPEHTPLQNGSVFDCLIVTCIIEGDCKLSTAMSAMHRCASGSKWEVDGVVISPTLKKPKKRRVEAAPYQLCVPFLPLRGPHLMQLPEDVWCYWETFLGFASPFRLHPLNTPHHVLEAWHLCSLAKRVRITGTYLEVMHC